MSQPRHALPSHTQNILKRYARARKPVHLAVELALFMIAAIFALTIHEVLVHIGLAASIFTWESAVIALGE